MPEVTDDCWAKACEGCLGCLVRLLLAIAPPLPRSRRYRLQIVFEVLLCTNTTSQAENVGWHHLGMQLDIVPRFMPDIARVAEFIMHLGGLCWIKSQGIEREPDPATMHVIGTQVQHHEDNVGSVCSTLAVAEEFRIIYRMEVQAMITLEGWILAPDTIHPRNHLLQAMTLLQIPRAD